MAYFVVERSRDDGTLSIPLPDAYETRDAALTALSAATASGAVTLLGEVFIADLGSAVPVLVMPSAPSASAPAEIADAEASVVEPSEDAEVLVEAAAVEPAVEDATEPGELDEEAGDAAFTSWEPLGEISAAESTLADALKRAATSLEEEGIVAPDSIVSAAEPDAGEPPAAAEELPAEPEEAASEPTPAEGEAEEGDAAWPWANVESYEIKVEPAELLAPDEEDAEAALAESVVEPEEASESEIAAEDASAPEEPAPTADVIPEEQAIITSAPAEGEEAYMPKPVILGDYLDSLSSTVEGEPEEPEEPAKAALTAEPDAEAPELSVLEEAGEPEDAGESSGPEPAEAEAGTDIVDAAIAEEAAPADTAKVPEVGYEATGELKLEDYSCQDCVYSNTCPKVGQTTPAECGSFQWRSE